ncbi:hypothetical protein DM01DRAFT_1337149 [Hesseltinella vesiculosa]|uniref:Myb-like domain-containing protein n=1 Tax=Hesseltinella vesiculosa TaxID=101127 RepID=A0A1X2GE37_9FUNG|nr:hypothetical protein DM01DRAFT_1337149 [Hesseltinella vesiculosa]
MKQSSSRADPSEAKRWLIVGAYQAGASEKSIARISGLSKTAVRNIILNYKRTGTPCLPKRESKKVKDKLVVEYDDNGDVIMSDEEEEPIVEKPSASNHVKPKSSKIRKQITTKEILEYMMDQVRQASQHTPTQEWSSSSSSSSPTLLPEATDSDSPQLMSYRLPSPTASISSSKTTSKKSHTAQAPPSPLASPTTLWCPTPPRDNSHASTSASDSSSSVTSLSPDLTPVSSSDSLKIPSKYDQTIRGYELWTNDDDLLLLQHVLCRLQLGNWRELEAKFEGRHTARLCNARWHYLRDQLLRGIIKSQPA